MENKIILNTLFIKNFFGNYSYKRSIKNVCNNIHNMKQNASAYLMINIVMKEDNIREEILKRIKKQSQFKYFLTPNKSYYVIQKV